MRKVITTMLLASISFSTFANEVYPSYTDSIVKKYVDSLNDPHSCSRDIMACPRDYNPVNDSVLSNLIKPDELNNILASDSQRSVFIPLELSNAELLTLAAATSLGVVAFKHDQEISDTLRSNNSVIAEKITSVGNFYGEGYAFAAVAAGSYFLGMVYENDKLKRVGIFIIGAQLAQGIVTAAIKNSVRRVRPNEEEGPYKFFEKGNKSFYSGHTATAFTLATVVSEMYKEDYPIVPYVAYGFAAMTAYARVHDKAHWASDVIIGAVAGHLIAKLALSSFNDDNNRSGLTFYPSVDPATGTFIANFQWTPRYEDAPLKCGKLPDGNEKVKACIEEAFKRSDKKKLF